MSTYLNNQAASIYVPEIVAADTSATLNQSVTNNTSSASIEMSATSAQLSGKGYVVINYFTEVVSSNASNGTNTAYLKIETKPIGGAYVERYSGNICRWNIPVAGTHQFSDAKSIAFHYVPAAGEYTAGMTIKITSEVNGGGATGTISTADTRCFVMTCK